MGKKILLATEKPFAKIAVEGIGEIFKKAGYEMVPLENYKAKEDLLKAVADADGMIIRSDIVDEAVLNAAAKLKIVVRAGAGYDNIDLKAATAKSIVAMNTPGPELQRRGRAGVRPDALPGARRLFRQVGERAARQEDRPAGLRRRRPLRHPHRQGLRHGGLRLRPVRGGRGHEEGRRHPRLLAGRSLSRTATTFRSISPRPRKPSIPSISTCWRR